MQRAALIVALTACAASAALPGLALQYGDRPPRPRFAAIAVESGASLLGGALLGLGAAAVARTQYEGDINFLEPEAIGPVVVMLASAGAGFGIGSGLGAWGGGSVLREDGRFGGTMLGALAGSAVGFGLVLGAGTLDAGPAAEWALVGTALAAPVAGSVLGYNLSRPCTGCAKTQRLLAPSLGVALVRGDEGRTVSATRLQLVGLAI